MTYDLLASALHHPDSEHPYRGLFNRRSLRSLAEHDLCSLAVVAPIPYAPPIGPNSEYRNVPAQESYGAYEVVRPRFPYLVPKSLLYAGTGDLYRWTLRRATNGTNADVAHGCHVYPDGYGLATGNSGRPLTITCHGHFLNSFSDLPPGVAGRVEKTLNRADHILCVSDALTTKAEKIANGADVSTVPIGADPANFPTERERDLRDAHDVEPNAAVVLFCGQFIERKGVADIIETLDRFPDDGIEYVFVGHGGDLRDDLAASIESFHTPDNIRMLEGLDTTTLREWYAISDLLLLPSYAEGRPTVIYEAMAAETAVMSTSIDGVSEQVVDSETGVLIDPGDQTALVETLNRLTTESATLDRMGKCGQQRLVSNGWTWTDHANRIVDLHQRLL